MNYDKVPAIWWTNLIGYTLITVCLGSAVWLTWGFKIACVVTTACTLLLQAIIIAKDRNQP